MYTQAHARASRIVLGLALACLWSACVSVGMPESGPIEAERALGAWARVLDARVDAQGRVDFATLAKDRRELDLYVGFVATVDPEASPQSFPTPQARMAHYVNAYNALSMYGVLELGIPRTNEGLRKIRFFFLRRYRIGGKKQSLYTYESGIRALGDPRVHFVLNCMSVSCPKLPRVPFRASALEADLEAATRSFVDDPRYVQVDASAKRVKLSAIFKFYTDDFLKVADSLIAYVNRYRKEPIPADYEIEFLPYDWTINRS